MDKPNEGTNPLKTMRANLTGHKLPARLWNALHEYDECRREWEPYTADKMANESSKTLQRLLRGMKCMNAKGILQITARHWDDQSYIKSHLAYFTDLIGLFYFDAGPMGEAVIAAILRNAWRKGAI